MRKLYRLSFTIILLIDLSLLIDHSSVNYGNDKSHNFQILPEASAAAFTLKLNQRVFVPNDTLIVYGSGVPKDTLLISLSDPGGRAIRIDFVEINNEGTFFKEFVLWPQPNKNFVFGQYTLKVSSTTETANSEEIQIIFAQGLAQSALAAELHNLVVKLDSPTLVSTNDSFRIFVQVTYDGALVDSDSEDFLGSSHIHFGNQSIINLSNKFAKLHEGIYYADVVLPNEGAYIIHSIAFHKGYESHDSKVVTASASTFGSIQESVNMLNTKLDSTNQALDQTNRSLNNTRATLSDSVEKAQRTIEEDVGQMSQSTGQINSIILPILALISVIIALQISLFARIRASYK